MPSNRIRINYRLRVKPKPDSTITPRTPSIVPPKTRASSPHKSSILFLLGLASFVLVVFWAKGYNSNSGETPTITNPANADLSTNNSTSPGGSEVTLSVTVLWGQCTRLGCQFFAEDKSATVCANSGSFSRCSSITSSGSAVISLPIGSYNIVVTSGRETSEAKKKFSVTTNKKSIGCYYYHYIGSNGQPYDNSITPTSSQKKPDCS